MCVCVCVGSAVQVARCSTWGYTDWMPGHPNLQRGRVACVEMFRMGEISALLTFINSSSCTSLRRPVCKDRVRACQCGRTIDLVLNYAKKTICNSLLKNPMTLNSLSTSLFFSLFSLTLSPSHRGELVDICGLQSEEGFHLLFPHGSMRGHPASQCFGFIDVMI